MEIEKSRLGENAERLGSRDGYKVLAVATGEKTQESCKMKMVAANN